MNSGLSYLTTTVIYLSNLGHSRHIPDAPSTGTVPALQHGLDSSHVLTIPESQSFILFVFLQGRSFLLKLKNANITVYRNRKRQFAAL